METEVFIQCCQEFIADIGIEKLLKKCKKMTCMEKESVILLYCR